VRVCVRSPTDCGCVTIDGELGGEEGRQGLAGKCCWGESGPLIRLLHLFKVDTASSSYAVLAAVDNTLPELSGAQIEGDAFKLIADSPPVADESRARQKIAKIRMFGRCVLCPNVLAEGDSKQKYDGDD
jgi:hypothetical protein